jgi:hypothetical protein
MVIAKINLTEKQSFEANYRIWLMESGLLGEGREGSDNNGWERCARAGLRASACKGGQHLSADVFKSWLP